MDLKHTTKQELAEENAALRKQLADVEKERDAFCKLAKRQDKALEGWANTCNNWRELYYGCRNHPWRTLYIYLTNGKAEEGGGADAADRPEEA